jgi:hypothetical protein
VIKQRGEPPPGQAEADAPAAEPPHAADEPALDDASRELLDHLIEVTWQRCLRDLRDARDAAETKE